ncbi:DUF2316 family protein [Bifidobacterium avesanii]|uniref:DUF2316 family protein n=1 Tax=Bifidobacterium avesanii TaxID=1798157 RepID=A0A7K3TGG5_9BIFI|nr:DUF2316 family protein [Bifidobacterium avesanii]KAB8287728.1 hypothetical protein DSM100685_1870 [Bifidobacterium avesanii]NEG78187.1 DUF2316 family protein [Bifidobacterium avesanii]
MSLTNEQRAATIREFRENMRRLGLTADAIGADFGVSGRTIERIVDLKSGVLEYPWIVRGYLLRRAAEEGVELVPFSALRGDPHDYWFLDDEVIDAGEIRERP